MNVSNIYFIIDKKGFLIYDFELKNHDTICYKNNIKVDKAYKFIYHPKISRQHKYFNEYGINGLRESNVYITIGSEPFELKKYHLDKIEKFIDEIESM